MNMFLTEKDFTGVGADAGLEPLDEAFDLTAADVPMLGEADVLPEEAFALDDADLGLFITDWGQYIKDNPVKVGGIVLGSIALIAGIVMLKKKFKGSAA
jgi:hypothetical protein